MLSIIVPATALLAVPHPMMTNASDISAIARASIVLVVFISLIPFALLTFVIL